jgi:hypothetical protein
MNYLDRLNTWFAWVKVPGYLLEVTRFGDIRNSITKRNYKTWLSHGYRIISARIKKLKYRVIGVHQLIALTFIGPCPKDKQVNHKDLNRSNNYIGNLEYVTGKQNIRHAVIHGRKLGNRVSYYKRPRSSYKLSFNKATKIRELYKTKKYSMKDLGNKFSCCPQTICNVINSSTWK